MRHDYQKLIFGESVKRRIKGKLILPIDTIRFCKKISHFYLAE
jgi:hypothetical protein